ncbi:MAG: shikimate dehydrogenase [Candidatus Dormibacteria bacterium]
MRLWLIGEGISGSPSPAMQTAAMAARGIAGAYVLRQAPAAQLPALMGELRSGAARGANVTIPHKFAAAEMCDALEGDAAVLRAVNTISVEGGRLIGDNTDARGFELALRADGLWPGPGCEAVVVGAGGGAAAVVLALSRAPAGRISVAARRPAAADEMVERLGTVVGVTAVGWGGAGMAAAVATAAIVINATPGGLPVLPFSVEQLAPAATVADLRYRPRPVDVVVAARAAGRRACDGLEMLLQQGMLSFRRWTGCEPPWPEARAALRDAVGG